LRAALGTPYLFELQRGAGRPQQALVDAGYTPEEVKTTKIYHGKGCTTCNKRGYKGRTGLYEVMEVNDELRELILVGAFGAGAQEEGDRAGDDYSPPQRLDQGGPGPDHDGRSLARDGILGLKVTDGWNYVK